MYIFLTFLLYISIILILPYLVDVSLKQKKSIKLVALTFISIFCAFIAAFRGNSGTDTSMYRTLYEFGEISILRWVKIEPGYMILNNFFKNLGFSSNVFLGFLSFLTTFFILQSINLEKEKINVYISSLVYFSTLYFQSFNIVRQALAVSICLFAMLLYLNNNKLIGIIFIILAALIHRSAILCLFIIVAKFIFERKNSKLIFYISLMLLLFLVLDRNLFGKIILVITGSQYYAGYVLRDSGSKGSFLLYYLKLLPVLFISFLEIKNYKKNQSINVMFILMLFGYILSSIGVFTSTDINRLGLYFSSCNIVIMGYCANTNINIKGTYISKNVLATIIMLYFILSFIIETFVMGYYEIVPYHNMNIIYTPFM